jgi:hypothetical protein
MMIHHWDRIVCVASGPSLTVEDCAAVLDAQIAGRCRVLVVNRTWERLPSADAMYAADGSFWRKYYPAIQRSFRGELWTCDKMAPKDYSINYVEINRTSRGLCLAERCINSGRNGGYQAINLAFHFGARQIILLGYDMQRTGGQKHWHEDYDDIQLTNGEPSRWVNYFPQLAADLERAGVEVVNCTRQTALDCFPKSTLMAAL